MRRVAVTGMSVLSGAGTTVGAFREVLERGESLGVEEQVSLPRGGRRSIRRIALRGFQPGDWIPPNRLRKMSVEAQVVTVSFLAAWKEAGAAERAVPPERTGTYLGTGFGSMLTTAMYLRGIFTDGLDAASPILFSESLANSPLGHVAIRLDARGPSIGLAGGDAGFLVALGEACRALRGGRIDRAVCGGYEGISREILGIIARLSSRTGEIPPIGEGAVAFVLEEMEAARSSGAPILAELIALGEAGDPKARPTDWSHDPRAWSAAHERALRHLSTPRLRTVVRHGPPSPRAREAEATALDRLEGSHGAPRVREVHRFLGSYAASGGLTAAAAVLACGEEKGSVLVSGGAWGGSTVAAVISSAEA